MEDSNTDGKIWDRLKKLDTSIKIGLLLGLLGSVLSLVLIVIKIYSGTVILLLGFKLSSIFQFLALIGMAIFVISSRK
jgi:hypothetical protein